MATVIGNDKGVYISTIEHLMSAISSYGIDNIRIILDANRSPLLYGWKFGKFLYSLDDEAGIKELDVPKKIIVIKKEVEVTQGGNC